MCIIYHRTSWVKVHGKCYKPNAAVIVGIEDDLPLVGQIQEIYYIDGTTKVLFNVRQFHTYYEPHYRAYTLHNDTATCTKFVFYEQLFIHTPIHIRKSEALYTYVILPHALCTM